MNHRLTFSWISILMMVYLHLYMAAPVHAGYRGGEITWECTPQGNFRFIMKLIRDCAGPGTFDDTLWITSNFPGYDSIGMVRMAINDITPLCDCPASAALSCATATQTGSGALEEHIYTSDAFIPNGVHLTGVPPPAGYHFVFEGCCRAPVDNMTAGNSTFALRSVMYNYYNTPINTCFDNTQMYRDPPFIVTCVGAETWYLPHAFDQDADTIVWLWTLPLLNSSTPVTNYYTGYYYHSPLPSTTHNPNNEPAVLNPSYGDITFTSYDAGIFAAAFTVSTYKMGIKVAETLKEMPIIVLACPTPNDPPVFTINGQPVPHFVTDTLRARKTHITLQGGSDTQTPGAIPAGGLCLRPGKWRCCTIVAPARRLTLTV